MKTFTKNEINTDFDLIARELKRARIDKKLSLEDVSRRTKINIKYLIALENGDFLSLPSGLYGKNFLKQYSVFLGLSFNNILEIFEETNTSKKETNKNLFSNQVVKNKYFLALPKLIKNLLILLVVLIFFSYLVISILKLNSAPNLEITFPPDNYVSAEKSVEINGIVDKSANISINGENLLVNTDGSFSKKLNLKKGINEVVIEAKRKYGRSNIIKKQILYKK